MENETRNDEIEVLRAIAILLVVCSHLRHLFPWHSFGIMPWVGERFTFWVGVDLFFCISGFVIARTLIPKLDGLTGVHYWTEVVAFWIRRWYRLIPTAWVWVAIILLLTLLYNKTYIFGHFQSNAVHALSALLNIANFYAYECIATYKAACDARDTLGVYWSLSLEEQFYFALPLLFAMSRRWFIAFCTLLVIVQFFIERHPSNSFLWYIRSDAILLGVLLAISRQSKNFAAFELGGLSNSWLRWSVFLLLCAGIGMVPANRMVWFYTGFVALISAVLVLFASFERGYLMRDGYLRRALVWIGLRSYAIYLIHVPVFLLTVEVWNRLLSEIVPVDGIFAIMLELSAVILVLIISDINYRKLETPMRLRGREVARNYVANRSRYF